MKKLKALSSIGKKKIWLLLFFGIAVAICVVPAIIRLNYIPTWVKWNERAIDAGRGVQVVLKNKKLAVYGPSGEVTFTPDKGFKVQDVLVTDIDRDEEPEMIALLWKRGIYGKDRPFWEKSDEKTYSQHIFLFDISSDGEVAHKWGTSRTGIEVDRMKVMERNESVLLLESRSGRATLWNWQGWGLKNMKNEVRIVAFGDNLIHTPIYEYAAANEGGSFDFLYEPFITDIEEADIAALNAETVLVDKESAVGGYPSFGSPIEVGEAVVKAGFDVVTGANNHALDRGKYGIDVSKKFYEDNGIICVGIQSSSDNEYKPYEVISRNGIRIAMFAYTYGTNAGDISGDYPCMLHYLPRNTAEEEALIEDLKSARKDADFVIAFIHWGEEYEEKANDEQKRMAEIFARGGTDVIIGSHPHVIQESEMIDRPDGGKELVYYSLGNFRADQGKREATRRGLEAVFTIGYSYDGVGILDHSEKEINAYWK